MPRDDRAPRGDRQRELKPFPLNPGSNAGGPTASAAGTRGLPGACRWGVPHWKP